MLVAEVIDQLPKINNLEEMHSLLECIVKYYGFEYYWYMSSHSVKNYRSEPVDLLINNYPEDFISGFIHKKRIAICPVIFAAQRYDGLPAFWDELFDANELPDANQEQLEWAAQFNIHHGIVCSIHGTNNAHSLLHFALNRSELLRQSDDLKINLAAVSTAIHQKLNLLTTPMQQKKVRLRPREIEVLFWTARGKTAWEIGQIIGISQNTAQEHIYNAMQKLNASTKTEAITKALVNGILSLIDLA